MMGVMSVRLKMLDLMVLRMVMNRRFGMLDMELVMDIGLVRVMEVGVQVLDLMMVSVDRMVNRFRMVRYRVVDFVVDIRVVRVV